MKTRSTITVFSILLCMNLLSAQDVKDEKICKKAQEIGVCWFSKNPQKCISQYVSHDEKHQKNIQKDFNYSY